MLDTFDQVQASEGEVRDAALDSIRRTLVEEVAAARSDIVRWHTVGNTIDALASAAPAWPPGPSTTTAGAFPGRSAAGVPPGSEADGRRPRRGHAEARHEWRKRAKYLWYQLRVLEPVWPAALSGMVGEADRLSDLLGEDHDLAVLQAQLAALTAETNSGSVEELFARIDRRAKGLQTQAFSLGQRLYAERPGDFVARVGAYYAAWSSDPSSLAWAVP